MRKNYCYEPEGYRLAGNLLWDGTSMLARSVRKTISNHKVLTALVMSILMNIALIVALAKARVERDHTSQIMYKIEHENDSLKGTNYKIYQYHV